MEGARIEKYTRHVLCVAQIKMATMNESRQVGEREKKRNGIG